MLLHALLTTGVLLYAMRRLSLRFGAMTFVFGSAALLMTLMRSPAPRTMLLQVGAAVAAGLVADLLIARYERAGRATALLRVAAALVPATWCSVFLLLTALMENGWWWEVHLATGAVVYSGFAGFLLSYVAEPKATREPLELESVL